MKCDLVKLLMTNYLSVPSVSKVCPPCDNELKADNIMEHYCASDFGKYQQLVSESCIQMHTVQGVEVLINAHQGRSVFVGT